MASDSKCSDQFGAFVTRTPKIHRLESGALLGQAGDVDVRDLVKILGTIKSPKRLPTRRELAELKLEFYGILALPNGSVFYIDIYVLDHGNDSEWAAQVFECHERIAAAGSGQQFAIGAMAAGKGAAEAVAIACRYDGNSGLPVREVPLKATKAAA